MFPRAVEMQLSEARIHQLTELERREGRATAYYSGAIV
jgi:hypothetical protein